ncbi:ATP-binding protein [Paenibacillus alginolyticus]|uniref:histidine kinase n=1 Tax=Paenibacillus alginolyticus TaxID=59839 RepID=A0ABT4GJH5_9BACL|nr:ATP-binding protein [Paenibacillus alginolyticus]MCY9696341.1 ATP-binding protein [Paenibacillus alginolyticus]MEC0147775.1 ATP-binding protein [Paenibacillus alginolyticus]
MKSFTRSRISKLYVVLIVVLLVFVSVSNFIASRNMETESDAIVHDSIPISNTTNSLLKDLINQETGIRGFQLSGNEQFLEPYTSGKKQLELDLSTISQYDKKYPTLQLIMDTQAIPAINNLQKFFDTQLELVRADKLDEAKARIASGKTMMDRYRVVHTSIEKTIDQITSDAYTASLQAGKTSRMITMVGSIIALIVGGMSIFISYRAYHAEEEIRRSEETYRYMAESLETQNEEIMAQQEEQQLTLAKLSERERDLELISSYQEKLTGYVKLKDFLKHTLPALLNSLSQDAALVVMERHAEDSTSYEVIHSIGYPKEHINLNQRELFGPARRVFDEGTPIVHTRDVSGHEQGVHGGITRAVDQYIPLLDDKQKVIGFLLLTSYQSSLFQENNERLTKGLVRQFGLAFYAQVMNDERLGQAASLAELNDQLTAEKQLIERQRDLIQNILESAHEGMMMCDSQGTILFSNHRMNRYFSLNERIGENLVDSSHEIAADSPSFIGVASSIEALIDGSLSNLTQRFSFELEDQVQHAELYATVVSEDTEQQGYLFVFRDRTEEERIDEMKNEFISIVSHELRTPLASVLGFIEILLHRELSQEKQKKYMETINKEAHRLSNLINDFLDLQRMESGRQLYHFSPVNLLPTLQEIAEQWQDKHSHRILIHQQETELYVRADADRIRQVFDNLISNAIKYSPEADHIDIHLTVDQGKITIAIQDYGLGIPEEARDQMFSKFFRVDNSDRRQIGGTGLGLAIVKEIVEGHNGHISYTSEMGQGTTFRIEFDLYEISNMDGQIVIFEDDDNLAKLIQVALNKLGLPSMQLRSAEEGIIALNRCKGEGPILFIVDIHLEGAKTGWDFIADLYRHPVHYQTPVIVSTALDPPHDYHEKEIEKYLKKPFTMERLVQVAKRLLDNKQSNAYVFPAQNKENLTTTLQRNGIDVLEMKESIDMIEVEIKKPQSNT